MTILAGMKDRALAEFDRLAATREVEIRAELAKQGRTPAEIDAYVEACRPNLAAERAQVGRLVTVELLKAGVPLGGMNDNVVP